MKFIRPEAKEFNSYIVTVNGIQIQIKTNTEDILYPVIPRDKYYQIEKEEADSSLPFICLLQSSTINSEYIVFNEDNLQFDWDSNVEYPNKVYLCNNQKILLNQYPNNSIIISDKFIHNYTIIASDIDILIFYFKMYLKKILIQNIGNCALHASAIGDNKQGFVFLGNGNSGKSTLAYNLSQCGWQLINDDLIFVDTQDKEFFIEGADINPCMRKKSLPYVWNIEAFNEKISQMYENVYHECFYMQTHNIVASSIPLKCFFALSYDEGTASIPYLITEKNIKMNVLKNSIRSEENDKNLKNLCSVPMYQLNINCPVEKISGFLKTL